MEVLIYRKQDSVGSFVETVKSIREKEFDERLSLYKELKLDGLVQVHSRVDPALFYPELSEYEYYRWREFLPTAYHDEDYCKLYNKTKHEAYPTWDNYCFDDVPVPILKEIKIVRDMGLFDYLIIRTPEKIQSDPIVIGIMRRPDRRFRRFLVARWGESLVPIEQIYKKKQRGFRKWLFDMDK